MVVKRDRKSDMTLPLNILVLAAKAGKKKAQATMIATYISTTLVADVNKHDDVGSLLHWENLREATQNR